MFSSQYDSFFVGLYLLISLFFANYIVICRASDSIDNTAPHVVDLDCDPCMERTVHNIRAIFHGRSSDESWIQIQRSMEQAADDMNINLHIDELTEEGLSGEEMAQVIRREAERQKELDTRRSAEIEGNTVLIVSIPDETVEETILEVSSDIPIFAMNLGPRKRELGLQGVVGQSDVEAGQRAAQMFLDYYDASNNITTGGDSSSSGSSSITKAVYIQSSLQPPFVASSQWKGFRQSLLRNNPDTVIDSVTIDPANMFDHVTAVSEIFQHCEYQAVLLGDPSTVPLAVSAKETHNCNTQIGVTHVNSQIYSHLTLETLLLAIDPQVHLQASLITILATIYITTGKKLPGELLLKTGPKIITRQTVPSDTYQTCQADSYPICNNDNDNSLYSNQQITTAAAASYNCTCFDRQKIRIGGILHGRSTDSFWDPVFAAAEQARLDMDIDLDLERFRTQDRNELIFEQMAPKIRTLCESGIDAIFVSIPHDILIEPIQICQRLNVPIISINSGHHISQNLSLLHHIGMGEYQAGYQAGQRMINAGIQKGYCLDHSPGNNAVVERCNGFSDAISDAVEQNNATVQFGGHIMVTHDNIVQYKLDVEGGVDVSGDWDGVGLLSCGGSQILGLREVIHDHPRAVAGTFDLNEYIYQDLEHDWLLFGIDQQPFFQGSLPVYLLTYLVYSHQALLNGHIESGPIFITEPPNDNERLCMENLYQVCPYHEPEDMHFISQELKYFGYVFFAINTVLCIVTAGWTFFNRKEWIVKVSQPAILGFIILGCFISSLAIPFTGVETSYRYIQDTATGQPTEIENPDIKSVDAYCMLSPWLYGIGFSITYSMLCAKIQRVKMIYQASLKDKKLGKVIGLKDVAYIITVVLVVQLGILTSWQIVSPYQWEREVIQVSADGYPIESYGRCENDGQFFFLAMCIFMVLCLFYALILCFQTKDIDDDFAESNYISLAVAFMFQVLVLAIPIAALERTNNDVYYFIYVCAMFLSNFTVLVLLFVPKMVKQNKKTRDTKKRIDVVVLDVDGKKVKRNKKKTIRLSDLTHSRWDEAVDFVNELLDEDSSTYEAMNGEQRRQLEGIKTLLLRGVQGSKENKLQYIPVDLMTQNMIETKKSGGGTLTYIPKRGVHINTSTRYIMREFGGIQVLERERGLSSVEDRSAVEEKSAAEEKSGAEESGVSKSSADVEYDEEKKETSLETMMSKGDEEVLDSRYYIPEEFYHLPKEAKLSMFKLLSWTCLKSWEYNIFDLLQVSGGHPLLFMGYAILGSPHSQYAIGRECGADVSIDDFNGYRFIDDADLKIPMDKLCNYLRAIEDDYRSENPYHNAIHAADVLQSLHALIQMKGDVFPTTNEELFSILLAAAVHDVNHPGENNAFQINSKTNLAITYNDISVLENRHAAHAFKKMLMDDEKGGKYMNNGSKSEHNVLCNASPAVLTSVRKRVIDAVLMTDMSKHFQSVDSIKALTLEGIENDDNGPWKVLIYMLHLADISNPARPRNLAIKWTDRCLEEFFAQGDKEFQLGLSISPNCDRSKTKKPNSQIGFINFVIKPAYEVLGQIIPKVEEKICVQYIENNLQYWKQEEEREKELEELERQQKTQQQQQR